MATNKKIFVLDTNALIHGLVCHFRFARTEDHSGWSTVCWFQCRGVGEKGCGPWFKRFAQQWRHSREDFLHERFLFVVSRNERLVQPK